MADYSVSRRIYRQLSFDMGQIIMLINYDIIEKIGKIIAGLILIAFGVLIIKKPVLYRWGARTDFTGFNIPLGGAIIIMGLYRMWTAFTRK